MKSTRKNKNPYAKLQLLQTKLLDIYLEYQKFINQLPDDIRYSHEESSGFPFDDRAPRTKKAPKINIEDMF